MTALAAKRLVLGMTGGIAAFKVAELTRTLLRAGAEVQVVMTPAATHFVTATTMQALSGRPVFVDPWDERIGNQMAHIELSRGASAILVAPASADFLAKLAQGRADDLLSALCLARACPLLVAPAMNVEMWRNPATQRNVERLRADGVSILGPASGEQACGEVGLGRMLEAAELAAELDAFFQPKRLAGRRVLVTAGPTVEPIDTVRAITNFSSGKMGYAVAQAACEMGAAVCLVSGPTALAPPQGIEFVPVRTADDMLHEVMARVEQVDVFFAVAAVADFRPAAPSERKIKRDGSSLSLDLVPNPDILATVAALPRPPYCVGFAAESEDLHTNAPDKRRRKNIPLIAANQVQTAFGADDNALILFDADGQHELPRAPKLVLARQLINFVAARLG
jgi:phosphopantothenoylcysteine decarboxylase/phosphopantothenate--cysteine ligase